MRKLAATFVLATVAVLGTAAALVADKPAEKPTIKAIMKTAFKDGLCKKVADGEATPDDAAQLVALLSAMSEDKPPLGSEDSWKEKTTALVAAAKACAEGKDGAGEELKKAANCAACHKEHKPKS